MIKKNNVQTLLVILNDKRRPVGSFKIIIIMKLTILCFIDFVNCNVKIVLLINIDISQCS